MARDGYQWWRQRLVHMSQYFQACASPLPAKPPPASQPLCLPRHILPGTASTTFWGSSAYGRSPATRSAGCSAASTQRTAFRGTSCGSTASGTWTVLPVRDAPPGVAGEEGGGGLTHARSPAEPYIRWWTLHQAFGDGWQAVANRYLDEVGSGVFRLKARVATERQVHVRATASPPMPLGAARATLRRAPSTGLTPPRPRLRSQRTTPRCGRTRSSPLWAPRAFATACAALSRTCASCGIWTRTPSTPAFAWPSPAASRSWRTTA